MGILLELLLWPIVGIIQALAGILWPSKDPRVRRMQRMCLAILLAGLVVTAVAVTLAFFLPGWHVLILLTMAILLLIGSAGLGNSIERTCIAADRRTIKNTSPIRGGQK